MTAALERAVENTENDRAGYIGRVSFELCRCVDCVTRQPARSMPARELVPLHGDRRRCTECGAKRALRGGVCRRCGGGQ